jgi:hypothetical protein
MQNVFLHSGWRCGSTYIWSKFRALSAVTAFYEPFSEKAVKYTVDRIAAGIETAWDSRHPPLDEPYAAEYVPLIAGIGVPLYEDRFAVQRHFVPREHQLDECAYLKSLIVHAASRGDRAVLGFSRSLGRVGAIKRHFPGLHAVLMRDPIQQWLSSRSYRVQADNPYFEFCPFLILALAPAGSVAARAAAWLGLPTPPQGSFARQYKFMRTQFRRLDDELSYKVFVAVYILSYLEALPEADLVIDMDLLSDSAPYGKAIAGAIFSRTGLAPDFSDCSLPAHDVERVGLDFARLHDSVANWLLAHDAEYPRRIDRSARTIAWSAVMNKLHSALPRAARERPQVRSGVASGAVSHNPENVGVRLRSLFGI